MDQEGWLDNVFFDSLDLKYYLTSELTYKWDILNSDDLESALELVSFKKLFPVLF